MLDPIFVLIGVAGLAFMVYAFNSINIFTQRTRTIGISLLMLVLILLGNRLLSPEPFRRSSQLLPSQNRSVPADAKTQLGWQDIPYLVFNLLVAELGNLEDTPGASSPLPAPTFTPSSSPTSPLPSPATPSPSFSPSPSLSPTFTPSPSFSPATPSPSFSPSPSLSPATPSPTITPSPPAPSPSPTIAPPAPAPLPTPSPSPPATPIPAWW